MKEYLKSLGNILWPIVVVITFVLAMKALEFVSAL